MSFDEFAVSVRSPSAPPSDLAPALRALWYDGQGNWEAAHTCVQDDPSPESAWVHAYLHRKEGDLGNAKYWYSRAGRSAPAGHLALDAEWATIARELLAQ